MCDECEKATQPVFSADELRRLTALNTAADLFRHTRTSAVGIIEEAKELEKYLAGTPEPEKRRK